MMYFKLGTPFVYVLDRELSIDEIEETLEDIPDGYIQNDLEQLPDSADKCLGNKNNFIIRAQVI